MMRVESWIVSRSSTRTGTDFCPVIHSTRGTWKPGRSERRTCAMPFQSSAQRAFSLKCEKRNCQRTGGAITPRPRPDDQASQDGWQPGSLRRRVTLMRTRRGWERVAGLALAGLLLAAACAADRRHAARPDDDDPATISADRLDNLDEEGAMTDLLDPEEREAMARAGLPGDARPGEDEQGAEQGAGDTAGKVGLSVLTVALSVGAAIAPLFLF